MEIRKKANYVLVSVNGSDIVIEKNKFDKQLLSAEDSGFLKFDTRDLIVVQMTPGPNGQPALGAYELDKHPLGYNTLHLAKNGLFFYELNEDSPVAQVALQKSSGLVTAQSVQGIQ